MLVDHSSSLLIKLTLKNTIYKYIYFLYNILKYLLFGNKRIMIEFKLDSNKLVICLLLNTFIYHII